MLAPVDSDAVRTQLWLEPKHGSEAYLAKVDRLGGRLRIHHFRGGRKGVGHAEAGHCPDGWQRISLKGSESSTFDFLFIRNDLKCWV